MLMRTCHALMSSTVWLVRVTKWSERTEGDLAGLLECRHERKRAVIWATNAPSEHLWSRFPQRQAIASSDDPDPIHADLGGVWLFLSLFLRLKLDLVLIAPAMIASWSGLGGRVRWFIPDRGREAQLEARP